jgi:hypothetical protein
MLLTNPSIRETNPYLWDRIIEEEQRRRMELLTDEAELRISQYVDMKLKGIEDRIREIENKVNQSSYNIETTINNVPVNNATIQRELKKMVLNEVKKALK